MSEFVSILMVVVAAVFVYHFVDGFISGLSVRRSGKAGEDE